MKLLYFIFFSLGLPLILQATASHNEDIRKPKKRCQTSSYNENDSGLQQKRSKESNITPAKSSKSQHSSTDDEHDYISKSRNLILRTNNSRLSKLPAKVDSNFNKLKEKNKDKKTEAPIEIEPLIYSEENSESEENAIINFLETSTLNPPIQYVFFKYITDIYSYDSESKTLTINGANRSAEIYTLLYDIRYGFSELFVKTIILKDLVLGYATLKTIAYFSHCYQSKFNTLIIDSCHFSSIEFISKSLSNVKKLKIINCTRIITFGSFLDSFKDTLEELVIEECHFSSKFNTPSDLNFKNINCVRFIRCSLSDSILQCLLALLPESLHTLEFSQLCTNSEDDNYFYFGIYLALDSFDLNVERFSHLKNFAVKKKLYHELSIEKFYEFRRI